MLMNTLIHLLREHGGFSEVDTEIACKIRKSQGRDNSPKRRNFPERFWLRNS